MHLELSDFVKKIVNLWLGFIELDFWIFQNLSLSHFFSLADSRRYLVNFL